MVKRRGFRVGWLKGSSIPIADLSYMNFVSIVCRHVQLEALECNANQTIILLVGLLIDVGLMFHITFIRISLSQSSRFR